MVNTRPIFLVNGILLLVLAGAMLLPAIVDYYNDNDNWEIFIASFFITVFFGVSLYLTNRGRTSNLTVREAFLFTALAWLMLPVFASMPFYFSELNLSFTDSLFEAVSGITTTGSTILTNLHEVPPGILLWRALLNGLGGVGIIVLAMAVMPMLSIGGMQLFRTESSDNMGKMLPRATQIASVISGIFFFLVSLCALLLWMSSDMSGFDAICHALTTLATGGFANYDTSIGYFNDWKVNLIIIFFMLLGGLPMMLYYQAILRGKPMSLFGNSQVKCFLYIVAFCITTLSIYRIFNGDLNSERGILDVLISTSFTVISIITTTGFTVDDYGQWGSFTVTFIFLLTVVGGCTGSTAGGIKIFRFQVFYENAIAQVQKLIQPHGVFIPRYNSRKISQDVTSSVTTFLILFAFSFIILSVSLSLFDLDFITSMSAAAQSLANVGPGLGEIIGPAGNYTSLPDGAKWLLLVAMIIGRLELFTIMVLFFPRFWQN